MVDLSLTLGVHERLMDIFCCGTEVLAEVEGSGIFCCDTVVIHIHGFVVFWPCVDAVPLALSSVQYVCDAQTLQLVSVSCCFSVSKEDLKRKL